MIGLMCSCLVFSRKLDNIRTPLGEEIIGVGIYLMLK